MDVVKFCSHSKDGSFTFEQLMMFLFVFFLIKWHSFSNGLRIPLSGDDWIVTDNSLFFARGQIPGTIHTILFAAGQIPDPYLGNNDVHLRPLVYSSWLFQKRFSLTNSFLMLTKFTLNFDQVDTVANITLNGCAVGQTDTMFIPYTFQIMRSCLRIDNELSITFQTPVVYAANQAEIYQDPLLPVCPPDVQHGECHIQFIRKEICSFSWDWGPAFAPIGIPGDLYLVGSHTTDVSIQLESVNVASYQANINQWRVDTLLTSFVYRTTAAFNRTLSISFFIPDAYIQLWWPNGYGEPILYKLSVYKQDRLIGSRSIGFRTVQLVEHDYNPTIDGTSFYFLINYHPIFIKGSNWIPPDAFQERVTDDTLERLLRSAQRANMNMLRISGVGIYERDSFYDLADRLGLMLWHDFMFGNALYPVDESFLTSVAQEIRYQVKRLQSHPSIVLWAGNNENEVAIAENWYGIPQERMSKVKDEYRKLNIDIIMRVVKEVDQGDNRPFLISSPTNGIESIREGYIANDPNSPLYGDVHFYGFHNDTWDPRTYPIPRFLTETGIQSLPSLETWLEVTKNRSDFRFDSDVVRHREHSDGQMVAMMNHIRINLPLPVTNKSQKNFRQLIYLSQINQAMTLKSISDACRLHSSVDRIDPITGQGNTMGLLYWQINDIWQGITWSTIEYNLRWKMAHYYVQNMYASVYPIIRLDPYLATSTDINAQISIDIVNERFNLDHGRLVCAMHTLNTFATQSSFAFDIVFDSTAIQHISDLPYASLIKDTSCSVPDKHCILHCLFHYHQQTTAHTLFLTRPRYYRLYQPNLRLQHMQSINSSAVRLTITASRPALFVWLATHSTISGYFSDNGFHLFGPIMTIDFFTWTSMRENHLTKRNFRISSLFDVTV